MVEIKDTPATRANGPKAKAAAPAPAAPQPARAAGPFDMMHRFAEEIDRVFGDFGLPTGRRIPGALGRAQELFRREAGLIPADWSPRVDVFRRDGAFTIRADLPGLGKDDVRVEVADDVLTIRGERKHEAKEEREGCTYSECRYGRFFRAIPLPEGVDAAKATATFRNGVLEVAIPAPEPSEAPARVVEIREA